jgi:Arc/MetJ-type ribon-helix-helix transcriptional regulator
MDQVNKKYEAEIRTIPKDTVEKIRLRIGRKEDPYGSYSDVIRKITSSRTIRYSHKDALSQGLHSQFFQLTH